MKWWTVSIFHGPASSLGGMRHALSLQPTALKSAWHTQNRYSRTVHGINEWSKADLQSKEIILVIELMRDLQMTCHMQTTRTHVRFNDIFRIFRFMAVLIVECNKKKIKDKIALMWYMDHSVHSVLWISNKRHSMSCVCIHIHIYVIATTCVNYLNHKVYHTIIQYVWLNKPFYYLILPSYSLI